MEKLIGDFSSFPIWKKALIVVGFPLLLLLLLLRGASTIGALLNGSKRERTDAKSAELDKKIEATTGEIKQSEGRLEQLESDKKEAIDNAKNDNSVDFFNGRIKPDGDK